MIEFINEIPQSYIYGAAKVGMGILMLVLITTIQYYINKWRNKE